MNAFAIRGDFFHTPERGHLEPLIDCLIEVDTSGRIDRLTRPADPSYAARLERAERLTRLTPAQCLLPGFVDLHVHASQWPQLGTALDRPLEDWLQHYTFPLEAKFADTAYAREVYTDLVTILLAHGTTTAVYFGTIHVDATVELAKICLEHGQRALIGKVAMDAEDQCPGYYRDANAAEAIAATASTIAQIRALQTAGVPPLVLPVITPRFLPTSSDELLAGLGALARETGCHVQTHCSESDWEVQHGIDRFGDSDTAVLDRFGLLSTRASLAHSNFVNGHDRSVIKRRDAAIAHCPLSNAYFANAVLPLRETLDEGVHVGLGSDIAGGDSPSILENARMALVTSRLRASGVDASLPPRARGGKGAAISVAEAFWLATAGGGQALGLPIGVFAEGAEFDAILVDSGDLPAGRTTSREEGPADRFERIVRCARPSDIAAIWVRGRKVSGASGI